MIKPVRLQRSRRAGSRMISPNGLPVRSVTRPSPFGNPFSIAEMPGATPDERLAESRRRFREYLRMTPELVARARRELVGCNLACWCSVSAEWCHAMDLLSISAGGSVPE